MATVTDQIGAMTSVGGAAAAGMITTDFSGSRDEWEIRVIRDLISRYKQGLGGMPGYGDASIGRPAESDFGTPDTPLSYQTVQYFENYVRRFGASDPWILSNFGPPPSRSATYQPDPNSPSSIQGTYAERSANEARENALDRESAERIAAGHDAANIAAAQISANAQITSTQMRVQADQAIAAMEDATRRYIAEGDWGVQRYVAELRESGAMERLLLELGARDKDRAQEAVKERNRHHEQMVALTLEVAKYDAELAAEPRNWLKYAAWLKSRDVVINGLTLAMAADIVPDSEIDPATVASTTGSGLAAIQTAQEAALGLVSGQSGGATGPQGANPFGGQQVVGANQTSMGQAQQAPSTQELMQSTDYGALAKRLLGMNPLEASASQATPENLQAISNTLRTSASSGLVPSFGAYSGPTTNALGVTVGEPTGQKVDYRNFMRLLPSQQQMKLGEVASIGRYEPDFVEEMERSRPKGFATGAASFG